MAEGPDNVERVEKSESKWQDDFTARPVCGTASTRCRSTSTHRRQTEVTARRPNRPDSVGQMPHVLRRGRPELRNPVLVSGFEGWNDAGEAASFAARFLAERWDAEP